MPFTTRGLSLMLGWSFRGVARPAHFYVPLFTSAFAPTVATKLKSELTEITAGNGYPAGGYELSPTSADFTSLTEDDTNHRVELAVKNIPFIASGGDIPLSGNPAYYAALTTDEATLGNRQILWYMGLRQATVVLSGQAYLLAGIVARILGGPMFKPTQSGAITFTGTTTVGTATINAVDVTKAVVIPQGFRTNVGVTASIDYDGVTFELTNATTVTATRSPGNLNATVLTARFAVIENF